MHLQRTRRLCVTQDAHILPIVLYIAHYLQSGGLSGSKLWFETQLFFYHLTSGGNSCVFCLVSKIRFWFASGKLSFKEEKKKKNYINFILYFFTVLYPTVFMSLYNFYNIEIGECWYDATKKTDQFLCLISWTKQTESEIYFLSFTMKF